ncbi:MAG: ATP-binding protein [Nitrospiraceae bacterium]|nr:ATP-binding protein [Nitrospiraceae bacterium]
MAERRNPLNIPYRVLIVFILLMTGIIAAGYLYYEKQKARFVENIKNDLVAITVLKVGQIVNWRKERLADAQVIMGNRIMSGHITDFIDSPGEAETRKDVTDWLTLLKKSNDYSEIILVDAKGRTVLSVGSAEADIGPSSKSMVLNTIHSRKVEFTDIQRSEFTKSVFLSLVIPVLSPSGRSSGALLLVIDPNRFLYPLIQTWPVASSTAETLLVRREGDDVVYINELRHRKNTTLSFRFSLSKKDLPAGMAVLGRHGAVEGLDYRGKPVFASVDSIPGSPWFIVTKVDKDEVYKPLWENVLVVSLVIVILIIASGLGIALWWRQQNVLFYREQYEREVEYSAERGEANRKIEKTVEELRRSNEELQQFAYIASHDLQEPLRMIASYLQLIERRYRGRLDKDADEFISYAVDGAGRLQNMIIGLLAYSRIETKGKPFGEVNLAEVLGIAISNLRIAIEESGTLITADRLPVVRADPVQLVQVFQNLLANAIKFRREDPPCIHVSAMRKGAEWIISVKDNGIGIAREYEDRIFNIFQRLHGKEYPGVGIGLSLCRRIVERHGGRIWFESEEGKGTTFYFTIPIKEDTEA